MDLEKILNKYKNVLFSSLVFIFLTTLLSGCSGLPDNLLREYELMEKRLDGNEAQIKQRESDFKALSSHKEWSFIEPYLKAEQWHTQFKTALDEHKLAKKLYDNELSDVESDNDPKDVAKFTQLIDKFNSHMIASLAATTYSQRRLNFLVQTRDTADEKHTKSGEIRTHLLSLQKDFSSKSSKATNDYPLKKDDLAKKVADLQALIDVAHSHYDVLDNEFQSRNDINYARFGDAYVSLTKSDKGIKKYKTKNDAIIDQLYKSYVRILQDQRIEYYVEIGRATWCEGEYCGSGNEMTYPASRVDSKVFNYYDTLTLGSIAKFRNSWGTDKFTLNVPNNMWKGLRISYKRSFPSSHDYAEYWVKNTFTRTFHKYTEIVNNKVTKKDWVKVNEDNYWTNSESVGMAVLTKPYGYYESDSIRDAQPAGISTVAKPIMRNGVATGSNQYGEWRTSNGQSIWFYYAMYRMFNDYVGPNRYSYNRYNTYQTTRHTRRQGSVRGAGSSYRSRGPSGGGK